MDYYNIPTIIDSDPSVGYEKNSWVDTLKLPLILGLALWVALKKIILGPNLKINTFWFDGASPICKKVKENATTWRALDIIYNYSPGKDKSFRGRITDFWNNLKNIKAVRNRLKLIKQQLRENIKKFIKNKLQKEVRLVSIASGSAQGVIEVMKEFKQKGIFIKAIFLDKDPTAIEYSRNLARNAGVFDQITFVNKSTTDLESVVSGFRPHIIEVTGLLEYRPDEKGLNLLKRIHNFLTPGGVLLTSNITPNPERYFSYWVGNWPMIYRTERELSKLVAEAGFNTKNCQIIKEPLKFHNIVICIK